MAAKPTEIRMSPCAAGSRQFRPAATSQGAITEVAERQRPSGHKEKFLCLGRGGSILQELSILFTCEEIKKRNPSAVSNTRLDADCSYKESARGESGDVFTVILTDLGLGGV